MAAAVFWDRDNTLIEDPGYINDPAKVRLLPGAAKALRRLRDGGYENIIVTNQSGIARGHFTEETLAKIHDRLRELLAADGAVLDAIYHCPYLAGDEAVVEAYRQDSDLRKPRPGMLVQASLERQIDLAASWAIGNSLSDTQAGRAAGCRTILLVRPEEPAPAKKNRSVDFVAGSLAEAVDIVLKHTVANGAAQASQSRGGSNSTGEGDSSTAALLREILTFLRMAERRQQGKDFSLAHFAAVFVQIVAAGVFVWALFSMIQAETLGTQLVRLMLTLVLQLMALTFFILARRPG